MDLPIIGGEEYEWGEGRKENLAGMSWKDACDAMDAMDDENAKKLGFSGGVDDLWDFLNKEYMINE